VRGRQAWLYREFADWYPGVKAETWHDAVWVRETVLAQLRHGSPRWTFQGRVLNDGHFKFQGVAPPQNPKRTRVVWDDVVLPSERGPGPTDNASKPAT
jgi:hypothetical protein